MNNACLIFDYPDKNADLFYATGFRCPDPLIFFENDGKKYMVMSDLEIDRAKRESRADSVLSLRVYSEKAAKRTGKPAGQLDVINEIFTEQGIRGVCVPKTTSFTLVDGLRGLGYTVESGPEPFYSQRYSKTAEEKKIITDSQKVVFASIRMARDVLAASKIKGRRLLYKGKALTSETLRTMINVFLLEKGFMASDTIVSCGLHAIDPHDAGSGPLFANESIIIDVFPRSIKTSYCGDATRTFCRGRASDALKKMYATVKEGQELGISMIKADIPGKSVHEAIHAFFKARGYVTGEKDGRQQGFFHGTGHSIGLEVHEEPARINFSDYILRVGNVMSVEPGLYYKDIGGVRIEDLVYITKTSCEVLSKFPKQLEI